MRIPERAYQAAAGVTLFAASLAGAAALASQSDLLERDVVAAFGEAKPSDLVSESFDVGRKVAEIGGLVVLAAHGGSLIKRSRDPESRALSQLAKETIGAGRGRKWRAPVAALTVGSAVMTGAFLNIADEVTSAQVDVISGVWGGMGFAKDSNEVEGGASWVISNSDTPELMSASTVPPSIIDALSALARDDVETDASFAPVRFEWRNAYTHGNEGKVQVLVSGLPAELTGIDDPNPDCEYVPVAAAEELGAEVGESFELEGMRLTVARVIKDGSGLNLLPVVMSGENFAGCLKSDPEVPFSVLLARGSEEDITKYFSEAGINIGGESVQDGANRTFMVPIEDFISNTEVTVKQNVNGLVLEAILLGLVFAGGALGNSARTELANNRRTNQQLLANGMGWRSLNRMYADRSRIESLASTAAAAPIIVVFDAMSNLGLPGSQMGPDSRTVMAVLGLTYGARRVGSAIAIRSEKHKNNISSEGNQ